MVLTRGQLAAAAAAAAAAAPAAPAAAAPAPAPTTKNSNANAVRDAVIARPLVQRGEPNGHVTRPTSLQEGNRSSYTTITEVHVVRRRHRQRRDSQNAKRGADTDEATVTWFAWASCMALIIGLVLSFHVRDTYPWMWENTVWFFWAAVFGGGGSNDKSARNNEAVEA